ncbi:MAG: PKD domain-containing protein, partial [Chloroflexota bacterium]
DGDLFIYLDAGAGGSNRAFVPGAWAAAEVWLPGDMGADYAIWVQDSGTAVLMSWDGANWITASSQDFEYVFESDLPAPQTDLLVPFSTIGDPTALKLVAFASEEGALRLWSTMPVDNSLNSGLIISGADGRANQQFALTRAYDWSNVGANGVCVSSGQYNGSSLDLELTTDPAAIGYSLLNDGLFFAMPAIESGWRSWTADSDPLDPDGLPSELDFDPRGVLAGVVNIESTALAYSDTVDILIGISNRGPEASSGVTADITYSGLSGPASVNIPDLAVGESGSATLTAQVNSTSAAWGSADIVIKDSDGNAIDWLYVDVEIDNAGPAHVELDPAVAVVGNGVNELFGAYVDQSKVGQLSINGQSCSNTATAQGQWSCAVTLSGLIDGDTLNLPIQATDILNQSSATVSVPVLVDTVPPTLTLSFQTQAVFDDNILGRVETNFSGTATDSTSGVSVEICQVNNGVEDCRPATIGQQQDSPLTFAYASPADVGVADCSSNPIVRTFTVADSFTVADLDVGLNLTHSYRFNVDAYLRAPDGTLVQIVDGGTGAANYALSLDDAALIDLGSDFSDHDSAQAFSNVRRPASNLTAFNDRDAAGKWVLSVCSTDGAANLVSAQLSFSARNVSAVSNAAWSYSFETPDNVELENQVLRFYAVDQAGNRSTPIEFTYKLDTRPPLVTFASPFNGTVSDGSGIDYMRIRYHTPDGETILDGIDVIGSTWSYPLLNGLTENEMYGVYVEATDRAGNYSEISPYEYINTDNTPPEANDDVYGTDEDTPLVVSAPGVLANDTDDKGGLTASLVGAAPVGSLSLRSDGSFTYNPLGFFDSLAVGDDTADSFTYRVTDSGGENDEASVIITISGRNDTPAFTSILAHSVFEDDVVTLNVDFSDPDVGDTHQVIVNWGDGTVDSPFNLINGQRSFNRTHRYLDDDPSLTAYDPYVIAITVVDNHGATAVANTTITVYNVEPALSGVAITDIDENGLAIFSGTIVDPGTRDTFTMTVDWGDGTAIDTYDFPAGTGYYSKTHKYVDDDPTNTAADVYTVTYTLMDDDVDYDFDLNDNPPPITPTLIASTTLTVSNLDPWNIQVNVSEQTIQYSDTITPVTVFADDVQGDPLAITTTWSLSGELPTVGLPGDLSLTTNSCATLSEDANLQRCSWTISGIVNIPAGDYIITAEITDDDLGLSATDITFTVEPEDAVISFEGDNPVAVQVTEPESNASLPFEMVVYVEELEPDLALNTALPGDITLADVSMTLEPVGPGSPVAGSCTPVLIDDEVNDYDDALRVVCTFDGVPVNTYSVNVLVDGGYYAGYDEDVLVIYDPSLGFTTGGGWFYWPGTEDPSTGYPGDKTNFGYSMSYNQKNLKNVRGSLLLIRHLADGTKYRVKSNALEGLSIGDAGLFGWASFSGKNTYLEPGMPEPIGNHTFLAYVEDHDEPGNGIDRFWIETRDKDGLVIPDLSMTRPGSANAELILGGNIFVPHSGADSGNTPPTADYTYTATGLDVAFSDLSSDPGGNIVSWYWDFGDGGGSVQQHPSHSYAAGGTYNVTLLVTDDEGASDAISQQALVSGVSALPAADFSYTATGLDVTFNDLSSDPDGTIVSWSWDFGDGATSNAQNPSHTFPSSGLYDVLLTVADNDGATDTFGQQVVVSNGSGALQMYVADLSGESTPDGNGIW